MASIKPTLVYTFIYSNHR